MNTNKKGKQTMNLEQKFKIYDAANPHIWELFKRYAKDFIKEDYTRLSAKRIFERIRDPKNDGWYKILSSWISGGKKKYVVNNNFHAFYARKWNKAFPNAGAEFKTRKQKFKEKENAK